MDKNFFSSEKPPEPCLFETMERMGLKLGKNQNSLSKYIIKEEKHESSSRSKLRTSSSKTLDKSFIKEGKEEKMGVEEELDHVKDLPIFGAASKLPIMIGL